MIKTITLMACMGLASACNNEASTTTPGKDSSGITMDNQTNSANTLTDAQKADGWQLLFDGQSLAGWHQYGGAPTGSAWKVSNGVISLDSVAQGSDRDKVGGDIVTNETYENFDLKLEWKISKNGNSGIIFYVHEDTSKFKKSYETGPEMQVLDNDGHPDGKIKKHRAGDLYDLISSSSEPVKAVGEWNQVEIKSLNGKLDFFLNGVNVVSTTMWDANWASLIANSKFKQWPGFGTFKKGGICLQDHGNMVWYRNVMIKKL
jgi:hypothetical protein